MNTNHGSDRNGAGGGSVGHGHGRARRLGLGIGLALVISLSSAACGGSGGHAPAAAPKAPAHAATTGAANVASVAPAPAAPARPAPEPQPAPAPAAPVHVTPIQAVNPRLGPNGELLPFAANTKPDVSKTVVGVPELESVSKVAHPGYVRYVFDFANEAPSQTGAATRPSWNVRYVPAAAALDEEGKPVTVKGSSVLGITFAGTPMSDGDCGDAIALPDPGRLTFGDDGESQATWYLGVDGAKPFRVFTTGTHSVAVDVVA